MDNTELSARPLSTGISGLPCIREDNKLNQWIFDTIRPYIKGTSVPLEIGSGTGHISNLCVRHGISLYLSDLEEGSSRKLYEKFRKEPKVRGVFQIDLGHPDFKIQYAELLGRFSTVFSVNSMQHFTNNRQAIVNAKLLLKEKGRLIVSMPASTALFNGLNQGLERWLGFNHEVISKFLGKDIELLKTFFFNVVGISGWWLSGLEIKKKEMATDSLSEYQKLVPLFRTADPTVSKQSGLSVIVVSKKN